jgi:DNA-binding transcriptional LysR family regulator
MRFDIADLRLFIAVVDAGSITHGAAAAHLSLPAASGRLREMEASGGIRLLERGRRGVRPTRAGEALAHHARRILHQMRLMQGELADHAGGVRASVRLLANTAAIADFLPDRLGAWLATHPRIDVELAERQSSETVRAVAAGLAELGIVSDAVDAGGLEHRPFATDHLVVVVPRGHRFASARSVAFAEILGEAYIGLSGALQDHVDQHAARAGRRLPIRAQLRTFEGVCRMAAQGAGIGIVPETAAHRCRRSMPIAAIRLTDPWATRRLRICFRAEPALTPAARDLAAHLTAVRE